MSIRWLGTGVLAAAFVLGNAASASAAPLLWQCVTKATKARLTLAWG